MRPSCSPQSPRPLTRPICPFSTCSLDIPSPFASIPPSQSLGVGNFQSAPRLPDPRLGLVDFQSWTTVPVDYVEAATAISRYLEVDHEILGLFDPEPFIQDLMSHGHEFCSSLLVNALLSWTSVWPASTETAALPLDSRDMQSAYIEANIRPYSSMRCC